eukprot:SAG31_NODE_15824_length_736_cov_1.750392_1_plen_31_part_10
MDGALRTEVRLPSLASRKLARSHQQSGHDIG